MTLRFIGEGRVGQRNVIARIPLHLVNAVDVWSPGVIFFYMLSGYHPFSDALSTSENSIAIFYWKKNWDSISAEGFALVQKILKVAPLQRATIEDILEDPWMQDTTVVNKMKLIVFADSNAIDNQPYSLHINENESVEESVPKRQRLSSC
ncbi:hypothetical protein DAPPUDRAFT_320480 [Daphnia pulex]|uniref:Protein kinase domain-containing protein n=1 Tax=Daphnia pulex TaxID=6669 RepID=E9GPY9_DAPPU|nr:hypothetical protein DAPPUDRAFT_320480 [Daphnia pulex]|eukprot:EFX78472.1 hypothetical protein DAPPUDRAFT_320480 [Daphnia pulex]